MGCGCSVCPCKRRWNLSRIFPSPDDDTDMERRRLMQEQWVQAGIEKIDLVVRGISGDEVLRKKAACFDTKVSDLVEGVCERTGARQDTVQLLFGSAVLPHSSRLGDNVTPPSDQNSCLELTLIRVRGPAIQVEATSGRHIQAVDCGAPGPERPPKGCRCHHDRDYRFVSLGDFATLPRLFYVLTSNDDKSTRPDKVMWRLDIRVSATVHINFRSERHAMQTGANTWLEAGGWQRSQLRSTVSTGVPNGPYSGPVFSKAVEAETVDLMGSNCGEGTYFVFIELPEDIEL
eukprot:gnl/TRDRNA2_/TRDRNA2_137024_c1_seq1.p1 gnl/TRDRNA2_/TRDRNA2_137024_c1~~gnl/TRDRNA2_/TRDRNA2_137024_c1_seq1.p1  ORF type:complete len:289 (-),score=28.94 gnl/TRDRNA2_/TRDRNA2_137024_c1_seq1:131-997(-)